MQYLYVNQSFFPFIFQFSLSTCLEQCLEGTCSFSTLTSTMPEMLDFSLTPFTKAHLPPIVACGNNVVAEEAAAILMVWFVFLDTILLAIRRVSFIIQLLFVLLHVYLTFSVQSHTEELKYQYRTTVRKEKEYRRYPPHFITRLLCSMCTNTTLFLQNIMFFN